MRALTLRLGLAVFASCSIMLSAVLGQSSEPLALHAGQAFHQGLENRTQPMLARPHFSEATDRYLELHRRGVRSPALYLNLGNAAALADRWPEALWAYHTGLKLDPNHAQLRDHRDFMRARVVYPASGHGRPEAESWPAGIYRPSPWMLAACAGLAYMLAWFAGTAALLWRNPRLVLPTITATLVAAAAGFGLWQELEQAERDRQTPLVIMMEKTWLYRGNGVNYPQHADLPLLSRGMEARQLHRRGAWLQIRVASGEIGWVPRSQVLVVEP